MARCAITDYAMSRIIFTIVHAAALVLAFSVPTWSQTVIPDDPKLITGKLENGLTYYIRHNPNPEGCADFYIIHNVGALQEEDNQNGLAHFLEHMAFNGTRHYPDKEILDFLARDGVRFGYNVNAYTNRTETVYNISSVPLVRESFVDSVLMVLHDWSCDISCEPEALDAERGVISEEWRRKDEPRMRMMQKQNDLIYRGSKHTRRSVLGTLEVINGFKPHEILDFYHKWYRPDLQAIVVVGDFDADAMVGKVRRMFSDIPASDNPAPKETYPVPDLQEPLFENMLDPQVKYHVLKVMHRQRMPERSLRNTDFFYKDQFSRQIVTAILSDRLAEAVKKSGSPLSSAVLVTNPYGADFYVSLFTLSLKSPEYMDEALAFYVREVERLLRYGFTEEEFEAARFKVYKKYRMNVESFPSDVTDREIVDVCKEHFLRGFSAANPYDMKETRKLILSELGYEDVKGYEQKMFSDSDMIYSWCMNESEAGRIPTKQEMQSVISAVKAEDIRPEYLTYGKISMDYSPEPGIISKTSPVKGTDSELWILGNGAKVWWTPSGEVRSGTGLSVEMIFDSGYNALSQDMLPSARFIRDYYFRNLGFGSYDASAIRNSPVCAGVNISVSLARETAAVSATSDRKSVGTCFKMIYGILSDPYFGTEAALDKRRQDNLRSLGKKRSDRDLFNEESQSVKYGSHPWLAALDSAAVEAVDMDLLKDVFHRSFHDYGNLSVFISGDLPEAEIKAMVEKYIASLDSSYDVRKARVRSPEPVYKGDVVFDRAYPVETVPKAEVNYCFNGRTRLSPENIAVIRIMDYIMSGRYMMQIREARGGTYHVAFGTDMSYADGGRFESVVAFQTRPEMVDVLVQDVTDGMAKMASEGPSAQELDEAKKYLVKHHAELQAARKNSVSAKNRECIDLVRYGVDMDAGYEAVMEGIDAGDIRKFAGKLAKGDKFIEIYREE